MDYTTVPRQLIYRDRRSLEEFGVYSDHTINIEIAKALRTIPFISERNAESRALTCMNNAYYICTMALLEKDPVWRIGEYEIISNNVNNPRWKDEMGNVTISLVFFYLCCLPDDVTIHLFDFLEELNKEVRTYGYFEHLVENIAKDALLPPNEFAPRYIDKETVRDALVPEGFNWVKYTNYLDERSVRNIVETFGKTEEEKNNVVSMIEQAADIYYRWDASGGFPEEVDKLFRDLEEELSRQYNHEPTQALSGNETEETKKHDVDLFVYEVRIKELEEEIEKLKSENKEQKEQQPPTDDHDEIDDLKEEIAYLKQNTSKLTSKEAAILTITACYHAGGLPSNRKQLHPILTNLFGVGEKLAIRRLGEGINEEGAEALAKCFDNVSPTIARTLREMPEKLKNKKKKRSHM